MRSNEIDAIYELAAQSRRASFYGPASQELVTRAEEVLAVGFPPSYRRFLLTLGCGGSNGFEFYGLIGPDFANSGIPDAVWLTLLERRSVSLPLPFVIVSDTGDGGYNCIDTSIRTADGENPVIEWWPGLSSEGTSKQVVAQNFGEFFRERALQEDV